MLGGVSWVLGKPLVWELLLYLGLILGCCFGYFGWCCSLRVLYLYLFVELV